MIPTLLLLVGLACMGIAIVQGVTLVTSGRRPWSARTTAAITWAALAWTVVTGLVLLVAPLSSSTTVSTSTDVAPGIGPGTPASVETTTSTATLLENEGVGIVGVLALPVVAALTAAVPGPRTARRRRLGAGGVLLAACLAASASMGVFYLPASLALVAAGAETPGPRTRPGLASS